MSAQRTVGTQKAREAAHGMRSLLEGRLRSDVQALIAQGRVLADPNAWSGARAAAFRQTQWPRMERSLVDVQQRLPAMHAQAASVLDDIIQAGSAGNLAAAPTVAGVRTAAIIGTAGGTLTVLPLAESARSAQTRLRPAAQAAIDAFQSGRPGIGVQGATTEGALLGRLRRAGATTFDLNALRPGHRGQNFPFLDAASDQGFFSVKTHLGERAIATYAKEYAELVTAEWGRSPAQIRQAVQALDANRAALQEAGAWPRDLSRDASAADIRAYILDHASLAVPDDHVAAVAAEVRARALRFPTNFGLPDPPAEADLERLVQRIVPSGIDSRSVDAIDSYFKSLDGAEPSLARASSLAARVMESPAGRALKAGGTGLAVAGDLYTLARPSPDALGGPTTERVAAGLNLTAMGVDAAAPLLAANAATDWIPGVGEVTMGVTAAYFVGDLAWQHRRWIEHTGGHMLHGAEHVASAAWHGMTSWL